METTAANQEARVMIVISSGEREKAWTVLLPLKNSREMAGLNFPIRQIWLN